MKERIRNLIEKIVFKLERKLDYRITFSQTGEDLLVKTLLINMLRLNRITYLDIGANDPRFFNNTYLLYKKGYSGILVEPNPELVSKLKSVRKRDNILNIGIAEKEDKMMYFMFDDNTLNTFDLDEANKYIALGHKLEGKKEICVKNINQILEEYGKVNFISIDIEGLDFRILKSLNFEKNAPECICIETSEHEGGKREDFVEVNKFLEEKGYFIYADTMLNTIYTNRQEILKSSQGNIRR